MVSAIRAAGSTTIVPRDPQLTTPINIASKDQWDVIYDGMVGATSPIGTAHVAGFGAKYLIAGKTGTAQVFTIKQTDNTKSKIKDERKRDHSWFIAYAPADDPKIAVAVLVENGGFGASVAAPIARKVLDAYLLGAEPADSKKPVTLPSHQALEVPVVGASL